MFIYLLSIFWAKMLYAGPIITQDSDLSPPLENIQDEIPLELHADAVQTEASTNALSIQFLRQDHGKWIPLSGLRFEISGQPSKVETNENGEALFETCPKEAGQSVQASVTLSNEYFSITNGNGTYKITFDAICGKSMKFLFHSDSNGGQALGIWQIAKKAQTKLAHEVSLAFWSTPLTFVWPSTADFYSWGEVNLTRGDHWDVIGHEMGHGIYDLAHIGVFGGGQHKIDQCYSEALALSEGWASFFSAWVSVDLADPDAKFEYMVPRRAPIRFETVPEDVCNGPANEWRVTSFLWDLIDTHDDGEQCQESFARVWKALEKSHVRSASDIYQQLIKAGIHSEVLDIVWNLNFKTPRYIKH